MLTIIPLGLGIRIFPRNKKDSDLTKLVGMEWERKMFLKEVVLPKEV